MFVELKDRIVSMHKSMGSTRNSGGPEKLMGFIIKRKKCGTTKTFPKVDRITEVLCEDGQPARDRSSPGQHRPYGVTVWTVLAILAPHQTAWKSLRLSGSRERGTEQHSILGLRLRSSSSSIRKMTNT